MFSRRSLVLACVLLAASPATAELGPHRVKPLKIPKGTPIKDAGTLHLSTGTWRRGAAATSSLGNDTVYWNDATNGYFTGFSTGDSGIDEGEIPASDHPAHGPAGAGAHPVGANVGTTSFRYSFQAWHRDGANPSDAISVDFVP